MISLVAAAFLVSVILTAFMRFLATRLGVVDAPDGNRKLHARPVPLLGGTAVYATVALFTVALVAGTGVLTAGEITTTHYAGFLIGGFVLMVGGWLDDRYGLPPRYAIIAPALAAFIAVAFGIEVDKLTNPFGGVIFLAPWQSDVLVFSWLMAVMYTTKFLDGLDGLATSISAIGALMVMCLALTVAYLQLDVAALAAVCLGAMLGFLLFNRHPASVFLGEGGSTFVGYALGTLAVISGGKLATALLVVAIPMMDAAWIVVRRFREGGIRRVWRGDRTHLHHRLLDRGWSQRQIVAAYALFAFAFGTSALFLQSREKLVAFVALSAFAFVVAIVLSRGDRSGYGR